MIDFTHQTLAPPRKETLKPSSIFSTNFVMTSCSGYPLWCI